MKINFEKYSDGLVPAIVQDKDTGKVLMLAFMNEDAVEKTVASGKVTFFSRSRNALWTKGETSGNFLHFEEMMVDCDNDTILVQARPTGPVCHTGADTCFFEYNNTHTYPFLLQLENVINARKSHPPENSYTAGLFSKGINKIAQKVGEEAVELVIEAKDENRDLFLNEAADLMYHYLVLLAAKGYSLRDVEGVLEERHR